MKRFPLILIFAGIVLAGCSKPGFEPKVETANALADSIITFDFLSNEDVDYEVIEADRVGLEEMAAYFDEDIANGVDGAQMRKDEFLQRWQEVEDSLANVVGIDNQPALFFERRKFEYGTVDQNGRQITLSAFAGWAVWPLYLFGIVWKWYPYAQNHVILSCPYTHTLEKECASKDRGGFEFFTMVHDNLFIMSDGQGFGSNSNQVQTYLNHKVHARQYFDALKAGMAVYNADKRGGKYEKDWNLLVVGASQGAGDAIAVHKYLDTQMTTLNLEPYYENESTAEAANIICQRFGVPKGTATVSVPLRQKYRFKQSIVCCGPYSPAATMKQYQSDRRLSYPCVIPLVIKSMLASYPELADKYYETDFFSDEWNKNKKDFDYIYLHKTKNTDKLNEYIREKLRIGSEKKAPEYFPLDRMLSPDMLDPKSEISKDLMKCLEDQDLTKGWSPSTETFIYYSDKDEVVPPINTELLKYHFAHSHIKDIWNLQMGHVGSCRLYMVTRWEP